MYTVNNNNLFDFGVNASDAQLESIDDGSSPPISLSIPIRFFERSQSTLYVSWLCIMSPTKMNAGAIHDDVF